MKRKFSSEEKEICWKLWRQGLGFSDIGRVINAKPGSIFTILRASGGYPPSKSIRSQRHLSLCERETISIGLALAKSVRQIAADLSRSPSTISREINKNGGARKYRASLATVSLHSLPFDIFSQQGICDDDEFSRHCDEYQLMRFAFFFQSFCKYFEDRVMVAGNQGCLIQQMA